MAAFSRMGAIRPLPLDFTGRELLFPASAAMRRRFYVVDFNLTGSRTKGLIKFVLAQVPIIEITLPVVIYDESVTCRGRVTTANVTTDSS